MVGMVGMVLHRKLVDMWFISKIYEVADLSPIFLSEIYPPQMVKGDLDIMY